ncbi:MAG: hypothetical protein ABF899_03990 [Oenococcus sp.]|uniref:hypothetical protein n=1 Tax=Oenococcus sp. TaxID=1979414 RepID=UPI0039E93A5A
MFNIESGVYEMIQGHLKMSDYGIFQKKELLDQIDPQHLIISGPTANEKELQDLPINPDYEELFGQYDEITVDPSGKILDVYEGEKPSYDCA